jgi:hypothetical protein
VPVLGDPAFANWAIRAEMTIDIFKAVRAPTSPHKFNPGTFVLSGSGIVADKPHQKDRGQREEKPRESVKVGRQKISLRHEGDYRAAPAIVHPINATNSNFRSN